MPRIRQNADRDAMKDFVGELNAQRMRYGYNTMQKFGSAIGICMKSAYNYMDDPDQIRIGTLRTIVKTIKPNPVIVLKAIGYSSQDIKKLLRSTYDIQ